MQHIRYTWCDRCQTLPEEDEDEDDRVILRSIKPSLTCKYTVQLMFPEDGLSSKNYKYSILHM